MNTIKRLLLLISTLPLITGCVDDYLTINAFEAEGTTIKYNLADTSSVLKVAVVSFQCSRQKSDNIRRIYEHIGSIMNYDPEVEIICFGETLTGWYAETPAYTAEIAETIPGPFTDSLACYARRYAIYISIGQQSGNRFCN